MPTRTLGAEIGVEKPIERLRPGSWIFTFEPGTNDGKWALIHAVLSLTHESGRKATEVRAQAVDGELVSVREWNNDLITGLTAAQAKKAGLTMPDTQGGGDQ